VTPLRRYWLAVVASGSLMMGMAGCSSSRSETPSPPTWSSPKSLGGPAAAGLQSVSCPTATFCMAVGSSTTAPFNGNPGPTVYGPNAFAYDGSTWSGPQHLGSATDPGASSVSCATPTFCVAVNDDGYALTFQAGTWSSPELIDDRSIDTLNSVSCPTTTFCVAVTTQGYALTYNGAVGQAPPRSKHTPRSETAFFRCPCHAQRRRSAWQ
jgi:hypothetical protein